MRLFWLFIPIFLFSNECFKYPTNLLKLTLKTPTKTQEFKLDFFNIYFDKKNHLAIVEYAIKGHKFRNYIDCFKKRDTNKTVCALDCDGGSFVKNKDSISFNKLELIRYRELQSSWILGSKSKKIDATAIECPKISLDNYFRSSYKDEPEGTFVCYIGKGRNTYEGCFQSKKSCSSFDVEFFGKYSNKEEAKKALKKCKNSTLPPDFNNSKGATFICYDYVDSSGFFRGCINSAKPCKEIGKTLYSKTKDLNSAKDALNSCFLSVPKE